MCPPSFLTGLKVEQSKKDGARLELKVQVKGDPDPQVTWKIQFIQEGAFP
jgi:hypothetical protein